MLSPKHTNAVGKETIATKPNGTGLFKLVTWLKNDQKDSASWTTSFTSADESR